MRRHGRIEQRVTLAADDRTIELKVKVGRSEQSRQRTAGEVVLEECVRSGADLLVKGAYTQSRLRQLMFGGATRHVLANARIPVVMAH